MDDIDAQVAAFADNLDRMDHLVVADPAVVDRDVEILFDAVLSAHSTDFAAARMLAALYSGHRSYAAGIAAGALDRLGSHIALSAPTAALDGEDGLLSRFRRLILVCREHGILLPRGGRDV